MKVFKKYIMSNKFFYIEIRLNKLGLPKLVLSCHKHRSKHFNFHYIYRICYKNAKKAEPNDPACNSGYCWLIIRYTSAQTRPYR